MTWIEPLAHRHLDCLPLDSALSPSRMATLKASLRRFAAFIRSQNITSGHDSPPSTQLKHCLQLIQMGRPMIPHEQRLLDAIVSLHRPPTHGYDSMPILSSPNSFSHTVGPSPSSVWIGSPELHTHQSEMMVDYTSWDEMDYEGDEMATTHRLIRGFYRFLRHHVPPKDPVEMAIFFVMEYHFIFDLSVKMVGITKKMKQVGSLIYELEREVQCHDLGENGLKGGLHQIVSKLSVLNTLPIQDAMLTNEVLFQRMIDPQVAELIHDMMGSLSHVKQFLGAAKHWISEVIPIVDRRV